MAQDPGLPPPAKFIAGRPQPNTAKMLVEAEKLHGLTKPIVGIHVRRTDKVAGTMKAGSLDARAFECAVFLLLHTVLDVFLHAVLRAYAKQIICLLICWKIFKLQR